MTREQAISVLECMAIDLTGCIGGLSKKNPLEDVCRQRIEAINTAQSALREKLERSEGCDFCKKELDDYPYIVAHGDYSESDTCYTPSFCPVCGRSLNEEEARND